MAESFRIVVADRGDAGVRLDLVIRRHLADVDAATRTRVQAWIEAGQVTVNGAPVRRVSTRAALGDRVAISLPAAPPRRAMAVEDVPLDVLYEDEHLIAINKPPGVVVHPAYRHPAGTLMNALLGRAREWPAGQRPSIVGRLDNGTSGIVLAAKSASVHAALQRAMAAGEKWYLAIVYGRVPRRGRIDLRLHLDARDRRRVVASTEAGAHSSTSFERLAHIAAPRVGVALVACRLGTGRRHQIRVHLSASGWPIVGDPKYGEPRWNLIRDPLLAAALRAFPRQALHARQLAFRHPMTNRELRIDSPLPVDMKQLMALLRLEGAEGTEETGHKRRNGVTEAERESRDRPAERAPMTNERRPNTNLSMCGRLCLCAARSSS
jgi:23S rRNA pseudouridine1911/1915/1917 synthase